MGFSYAEITAQAGCDPSVTVQPLMEANEAEVAALGDLFVAAGQSLQTSGEIFLSGTDAAAAAAQVDDATPVDLMSEVVVTQQSLAASPEQLQQIGVLLGQVAETIPVAQQQAITALETMATGINQVNAEYDSLPRVPDLTTDYLAKAALVVTTAQQEVTAVIQAHDEYLATVNGQLQSLGYLSPPEVSKGDSETMTVPAGEPTFSPDTPPVMIAAWWDSLTPEQQAFYIENYGEELSVTRGLPAEVYDVINRRELTNGEVLLTPPLQEAADDYKQARGITGDGPLSDNELEALIALAEEDLTSGDIALATAAALFLGLAVPKYGIDQTQKALVEDKDGDEKYLLEFELDGPGDESAAVIAIGNPDEADNVAVTVPGTDNGTDTVAGQTETGEDVKAEMDESAPDEDNAVIIYQGYDNPNDIAEATLDLAAEAGGQELAKDVAGYDAANTQDDGEDPHITVIGHSYGSLVVSEATQQDNSLGAVLVGGGPAIDDVVVIGSPGMNVDSIDQLGIDPEHVYAGATSDDPVVFSAQTIQALAGLGEISPYGLAASVVSDVLDQSPLDFGLDYDLHGPPPSGSDFGATVFSTDGSSGHSQYYKEGSESLANIAAIATGDYASVTTD
ncbi:hypothetical protein EK0264_14025 [Epidermidibacterium keratini]|uniref:Alpha/beta hydrolase n=1 Tax=Epidermidibacterium keratini TaxID=1891644 RepID=A0A7L4YQI7_9ACTN|nr:alpha/beta hydrolase [Epidermidibacterium keratini]QHC01292.1 hypothetical protein EK0264_14025 [Epidermidibacterium keratini]